MQHLAVKYLEQAHGNRTCALLGLAADFMRGNPADFKQGYSAGSALLAAASVLGRNEFTFTSAELQKAVEILDALAVEPVTA